MLNWASHNSTVDAHTVCMCIVKSSWISLQLFIRHTDIRSHAFLLIFSPIPSTPPPPLLLMSPGSSEQQYPTSACSPRCRRDILYSTIRSYFRAAACMQSSGRHTGGSIKPCLARIRPWRRMLSNLADYGFHETSEDRNLCVCSA